MSPAFLPHLLKAPASAEGSFTRYGPAETVMRSPGSSRRDGGGLYLNETSSSGEELISMAREAFP